MESHTTTEEGAVMDKKPYEAPKVFELGTVKELTETTPEEDKCSGSNDRFAPSILSPEFNTDCP